MRSSEFDFQDIFKLDITEFFTNLWEENLVLTHNPKLQQLFAYLNLDCVKAILEKGIELQDLLVLRSGIYAESVSYISDNGLVSPDLIQQLYQDEDCTIYIKWLEKYDQNIANLVRALSNELHPLNFRACLFLSASSLFGLPAHFDAHDAFIIQISGTKKWQIWPAIVDDVPSVSSPNLYATEVEDYVSRSATIGEFNLSPGDILYLPRNTIHKPLPTGDRSCHLNIWMLSPLFNDYCRSTRGKYRKT
jgi:hypothetical protein